MQKDFDKWNLIKKRIDCGQEKFSLNERQIWWCSIGLNIGSEQNGHGDNFERPILIIKKYTADIFLCLPLTSKEKKGTYYHKMIGDDVNNSWAILSQSKVLDRKRLIRFVGSISRREFVEIISKYKELI